MALKVKGVEQSVTKWSDNASRAAEEYASNAQAAADQWATQTKNAADTFHQAISAPGIKNRFLRGVTLAGASKYARKIGDVARDRFAPGISAASQDFRAGVEPYLQTLAGLSLSQRKPRGDPSNYRRVEEVGKALNAKRMAMLGGGGI